MIISILKFTIHYVKSDIAVGKILTNWFLNC